MTDDSLTRTLYPSQSKVIEIHNADSIFMQKKKKSNNQKIIKQREIRASALNWQERAKRLKTKNNLKIKLIGFNCRNK